MDLGKPIKKGTVIPATKPISVPRETPQKRELVKAPVREKEPADA